VQVKGRKTDFIVYELLASRGSSDLELRARHGEEHLSTMTWKASEFFEARNFAAARRIYLEILARFPGDPVAIFMLGEIETRSPADLTIAVSQ
jgi:hypothetical protein